MNTDYWKGFAAGQEHERKKLSALLAFYLESLKDVPGIGPKTWQRIVEHINSIDVRERKEDVRKIQRKTSI